jgi:hypothetical protein
MCSWIGSVAGEIPARAFTHAGAVLFDRLLEVLLFRRRLAWWRRTVFILGGGLSRVGHSATVSLACDPIGKRVALAGLTPPVSRSRTGRSAWPAHVGNDSLASRCRQRL